MRNVLRAARLTAVIAALVLPAANARAQAQVPTVTQLRLSGVVDPFSADYVRAGIAAANAQHDAAVLLTIDTPGGLDSSMREIVQSILGSRIPVICYVWPEGARAASAGTFIMMACPVAAMAPGTNIGAAHPVGVAGAIEEQKVTNDAAAYIQDLAHRNGRNESWARDAVVRSVSIPSNEALRIGVIDLVEPSEGALLRAVEGRRVEVAGGRTVTLDVAGARVRTLSMGVGAAILHTLLSPDFAFIFFYLGLGLIVIELLHPGLSVPGILGAVSLVTAFVTFGLLPVQIIGVVLLLASALFFLLELKHPGLGLATVGGVACLILGGLTLFNPSVPNARVSLWVILPVAGFLVLFFGTVVNAALRARRLPRAIGVERLVGQEGVVERELAPDGVVLVASEEWSARSTGGVLPAGTRVRVVGVDRLRLDVTPIDLEAPTSPGPERGKP
ncbi:MAG TPA: nodulation protein NfeD [Actinomycetota bacterium]|nr:nodulation protein NfeD [Actinomycetota bacterium]